MRQREGVRGVIYKGVLAIPIIEHFIDLKAYYILFDSVAHESNI